MGKLPQVGCWKAMKFLSGNWYPVLIFLGPVFQDGKCWYKVKKDEDEDIERYAYAFHILNGGSRWDLKESIKGYMIFEELER